MSYGIRVGGCRSLPQARDAGARGGGRSTAIANGPTGNRISRRTEASERISQALPRWEQRLGDALPWYGLVFLGSILLATGVFPLHLTGALQWLANLAVTTEFVVFLPVSYFLIVRAMRQNPATSRSWTWGTRLLVTGAFGVSVLFVYGSITGLLSDWQRSNAEISVLVVLGAVLCVLFSLGLVLVVAALIEEARQFMRARYRRPPTSSGL